MNEPVLHSGWTGREATALRRAMGLTAERFAARVEVSARTVVHWAANPDTVPQTGVQNRLDVVFRAVPPRVLDEFLALAGPTTSPAAPADLTRLRAAQIGRAHV